MKLLRVLPVLVVLFGLFGIAHAIELGSITIRNASNSTVGSVDSDGTIRNSSNSSVGKVEGYSPRLRHLVAAVLFFGGSVSVLEH
jgi:hypothetical protein